MSRKFSSQPLPPSLSRGIVFEPNGERRPLTPREEQIVGLICDGLADAEISSLLDHPASETKKTF